MKYNYNSNETFQRTDIRKQEKIAPSKDQLKGRELGKNHEKNDSSTPYDRMLWVHVWLSFFISILFAKVAILSVLQLIYLVKWA